MFSNRPVHSLSFAVLAQRLQEAGSVGHGGGYIRMAAAQLHDLQAILSSQPEISQTLMTLVSRNVYAQTQNIESISKSCRQG